MAVPKKRTTKAKQGRRRSHLALQPVSFNACSNCGKPVQSHRACPACGFYNGKQVLKV